MDELTTASGASPAGIRRDLARLESHGLRECTRPTQVPPKVGLISPAVVCSPGDIDQLITNNGISGQGEAVFEKAGV